VCETTNKDGYVLKFSVKGKRLWRTEVKSDRDDFARGVALGPRGVYVVGTTAGVIGSQTFGGFDGYLRLLDVDSGKTLQ
jgi:hypothetical protein